MFVTKTGEIQPIFLTAVFHDKFTLSYQTKHLHMKKINLSPTSSISLIFLPLEILLDRPKHLPQVFFTLLERKQRTKFYVWQLQKPVCMSSVQLASMSIFY